MTPAKVELGTSLLAPYMHSVPQRPPYPLATAAGLGLNTAGLVSPCATSGEWVSAVSNVAPYLNAQGLRKALDILDKALSNTQRMKAFEAIAFGQGNPHTPAAAQNIITAEVLRMQLCEEQRQLLQELQSLRMSAWNGGAMSSNGSATAGLLGGSGTSSQEALAQVIADHANATPGATTAAAVAAAMAATNKIQAVNPHTMAIAAAATELLLGALAEASAATMNPSSAETTAAAAAAAVAAAAAANSGAMPAAASPAAMAAAAMAAATAAATSPPEVMGNGRGRSRQGPASQGYPAPQYPPRQFCQNPNQRTVSMGRQVGTLSGSLQTLSTEDPDCLFIVRRINKLGFKASRKLKLHFTRYGPVVRVLVAHSTVRQHGDGQCYGRRRPSSLGFVQMLTDDSVKRVLLAGEEHQVEDVVIRVQRFQRQAIGNNENEDQDSAENADSAGNAEAEETEEAQAMERHEKENNLERQHTSSSGVSTAASSASSAGTTLPETEE